MQAKLIRDDMEVSPAYVALHAGDIEFRQMRRNNRRMAVPFYRPGTVVAYPDCWLLVLMGCAVPADDECRETCREQGWTEAQSRAAEQAYNRLIAGIHPDDFSLFDAGIITGYLPGGGYKPGPNFDQLPKKTDDEDDD